MVSVRGGLGGGLVFFFCIRMFLDGYKLRQLPLTRLTFCPSLCLTLSRARSLSLCLSLSLIPPLLIHFSQSLRHVFLRQTHTHTHTHTQTHTLLEELDDTHTHTHSLSHTHSHTHTHHTHTHITHKHSMTGFPQNCRVNVCDLCYGSFDPKP